MEIYAVSILQLPREEEIVKLVNVLSPKNQERLQNYKNYKSVCESVIGELLVRYYLKIKYGLNDEQITFSYNAYGKPFINNLKNFFFSISHSGQWVVCAFDYSQIGIDIEEIVDIDFSIADKFFAKREIDALNFLEGEDKRDKFFEIWTLKESYIKAIGKGMSIPLNSFSVVSNNHYKIINIHETERREPLIKLYTLDPKYKLAVTAYSSKPSKGLSIVSLYELLGAFSR